MRELKQNPYAAVKQVLEARQPFEITSRGYDTGVVIQPATGDSHPRRYVSGEMLNALRSLQLSADEKQSWKDDIAAAVGDDAIEDPWGDR